MDDKYIISKGTMNMTNYSRRNAREIALLRNLIRESVRENLIQENAFTDWFSKLFGGKKDLEDTPNQSLYRKVYAGEELTPEEQSKLKKEISSWNQKNPNMQIKPEDYRSAASNVLTGDNKEKWASLYTTDGFARLDKAVFGGTIMQLLNGKLFERIAESYYERNGGWEQPYMKILQIMGGKFRDSEEAEFLRSYLKDNWLNTLKENIRPTNFDDESSKKIVWDYLWGWVSETVRDLGDDLELRKKYRNLNSYFYGEGERNKSALGDCIQILNEKSPAVDPGTIYNKLSEKRLVYSDNELWTNVLYPMFEKVAEKLRSARIAADREAELDAFESARRDSADYKADQARAAASRRKDAEEWVNANKDVDTGGKGMRGGDAAKGGHTRRTGGVGY